MSPARFIGIIASAIASFAQAAPFPEKPGVLERPLVVGTLDNYGAQVWWRDTVRIPDALFVRLRIEDIRRPPDRPFAIVLREEATSKLIIKYESTELDRNYIVTPRLGHRAISVRIEAPQRPDGAGFTVTRYTHARKADTTSLSIPQVIPWTDAAASKLPVIAKARDSVALMFMESSSQFCTAFVVSKRHLLTNEHCLRWSADYMSTGGCNDIRFEFTSGGPEARVPVRCARIVHRSSADHADVAILEVAAPGIEVLLSRTPLRLESAASRLPRAVLVLHHPGGTPVMQVSAACELSVGRSANLVNHDCATIGGSSGAPLLDASTGAVVALHSYGFEEGITKAHYDWLIAQGKKLYNQAVDGAVVNARVKEHVGGP